MKPAYWIGIFAIAGGVIGYAIFSSTGWMGSSIGVVIGILIGALVANLARQGRKI